MAIGAFMPKSLPKVGFAVPFDVSKERKVLHMLIDKIACGYVSVEPCVQELALLAHSFVDHPSESSLRRILSFQHYAEMNESSFFQCQQLIALFKKNNSFDLGIDTERAAIDTFYLGEARCRQTNIDLRNRDDHRYGERATLIFKMSRKISLLLGPVPRLDDLPSSFGPGANIGVSKNTSARFKLQAGSTTVAAYRLLGRMLDCVQTTSDPSRFSYVMDQWPGLYNPSFVSGSRFTTVPKTALTDRGINVEPVVNSYLQKGIGGYMRKRLLRFGVNLNDQTINQRLAQIGSRDGSLATIDLSMASDTIAYLLVMDLLPLEWFELLDACRSPVIEMPDGTSVIAEKFSAMGNGYTFELESLIFWAMLACVCDGSDDVISVYGDDLICPTEKYDEVIAAIDLLGFIPNKEKSFNAGPFRESCGKDYWDGTDVRPIFVKERLSIRHLYRLFNYSKRTGRLDCCDDILAFIPKTWRHYGPDGYGDGHLIGEVPVLIDKRGWEPFYQFRSFSATSRRVEKTLSSDAGCFLYYARAENKMPISSFMYNERTSNPRYQLKRVRVPVGTYQPLANFIR